MCHSLSELPEVHVKIATQHGVLKQLICIALSPSVQIMSSILVATLFLCLAATRETHPFITVGIIGLMEACVRESDIQTNQQKERDNLLLKLVCLYSDTAASHPSCSSYTLLASDTIPSADAEFACNQCNKVKL